MRIPVELLAAGLCLTACGPAPPATSGTDGGPDGGSDGSTDDGTEGETMHAMSCGGVGSGVPTGGMSSATDPLTSGAWGTSTDGYDPCECFVGETRECDGGTGAQVCVESGICGEWSDCYSCEEGEPWPCNFDPCEEGCEDGEECNEWGFCVQATWIPICERQALSLSETALQSSARDLELADVDGDGALDLVVLLNGTNEVEVARGDGAGHFFASTTYPTALEAGSWSMVIADFNGDGWLDVAATSDSPIAELSLLFGQAGVFGAPVLSALEFETWRTFAGDFDGDGNPDLLTYNLDPTAELALYRGDGNGGFLAAVAYDDPSSGTFGIAVGAVAGGALPDVVVPKPSSPSLTVLEFSQGGFKTVATLTGKGTTPYRYVMAGDIDGDMVGDVVAYRDPVGSDQLQTWRHLTTCAELNVDWILPETIADVNGDGRDDLVANVWGSDLLKVIYFDAPCIQTYDIPGSAEQVVAGDVDDDGKMDIVAASYGSGTVWILRTGP